MGNTNGSCKYCSTCTNDSCKCPSKDDCAAIGTTVGIIVGVVFFIFCIVCCYCQRKRRWKWRVEGNRGYGYVGNQPYGGSGMQPATYQPPVMMSTMAQPVQPVTYVQQPVSVQPATYIQQQPVQQQMYSVQQQQVEAPPSYMTVEQPSAPPSYNNVPPPDNDGHAITQY